MSWSLYNELGNFSLNTFINIYLYFCCGFIDYLHHIMLIAEVYYITDTNLFLIIFWDNFKYVK